jgi:hypothetical protein
MSSVRPTASTPSASSPSSEQSAHQRARSKWLLAGGLGRHHDDQHMCTAIFFTAEIILFIARLIRVILICIAFYAE